MTLALSSLASSTAYLGSETYAASPNSAFAIQATVPVKMEVTSDALPMLTLTLGAGMHFEQYPKPNTMLDFTGSQAIVFNTTC